MKLLVKMFRDVSEDNWEKGEVGNNFTSYSDEIKCDSSNLLEAMSGLTGHNFKVNDLEIIDDEYCYFNALENADSMKPTEQELKLWKEGKINLYSVSYHFKFYKLEEIKPSQILGEKK